MKKYHFLKFEVIRKVPDLFVTFHSPLKDEDVKSLVSTVTFWPCMLRKRLAVVKKKKKRAIRNCKHLQLHYMSPVFSGIHGLLIGKLN